MRRLALGLGAITAAAAISGLVWATRFDPEARVTQLRVKRQDGYTAAIKGTSGASIEEVDRSIAEEANRDLRKVDPNRIAPADAYQWSRLYHLARDYKTERFLLDKAMTASSSRMVFQVHSAYWEACAAMKDGTSLAERLKAFKANSDAEAWSVGLLLAGSYHILARDSVGAEEAIKLIDQVSARIPNAAYESESARLSSQGALLGLTRAKASILFEAGRVREGGVLLKKALKTFDPKLFNYEALREDRFRLDQIGKSTPSLPAIKSLGAYSNLASLKGKVVLLDFTAHWCKPCKDAIPHLKKFYEEFRADGLEILSVTQFYGHFGAERFEKKDMPPAGEFAHVKAWMDDARVEWPMVFVSSAEFRAFGVRGIPHFVLIDREGKVATIDIGFSEPKFKRLRSDILRSLQ